MALFLPDCLHRRLLASLPNSGRQGTQSHAPHQNILAAAAVLATGLSAASAQTIKIGSKNFTEQFVVAELYAAALENAGFKVERKINLGGTLVAHEALKSGAIDLYPEYTGTGLNAVMKAQGVTETDPEKVRGMVKAFYEKEFNLTWLKPSGINNGYAIVVGPRPPRSSTSRP
jgi:osmoprotectant transport system substrate-binding protein